MKGQSLILPVSVLILGFFYGPSALAGTDGDFYTGIQYSTTKYEDDDLPEFETGAGIFRFGKFYEDYLAFEGRAGVGLEDDSKFIISTDVEFEVDSLYGVYVIAQPDLNDWLSFYGIAGFSVVDVSLANADALGLSTSADESGLSYGVGVDLGKSERIKINIEYMIYLSEDDFEFEAVSLGVRF